jgi:UDP-2,3-diacylglucosamine hydrolase
MSEPSESDAAVGIVAGGGALPAAVAHSLEARGRRAVVFAIRGFCDPATVEGRAHHWVALGQIGRLTNLLRREHCHDVVPVGSLVRPALSELRLDWQTLRMMPALVRAFRGGDDHLLTSVARIFADSGFRLIGVNEVAPELTVPQGVLTRRKPDDAALRDIAKGRAALAAMSAFDVGQAAVVIDQHVVALEDIGGTDALLQRVARLRETRRIRAPAGRGVLVKAPKTGQELRLDMPTLGPTTVSGAAQAQLVGIAVVAGQTLLVEPDAVIAAADRNELFVAGVPA